MISRKRRQIALAVIYLCCAGIIVVAFQNFKNPTLVTNSQSQFGIHGNIISKENSNNTVCRVPRFDQFTKPDSQVACQRRTPKWDSCKIAEETVFWQPKPSCKEKMTYNICQIMDVSNSTAAMVVCSSTLCNSNISLGTIDVNHGTTVWEEIANTSHLQDRIQNLVEQPLEKPNFGFCFIKCNAGENDSVREKEMKEKKEKYFRKDTHVKQMLLLPPQLKNPDAQITNTNKKVNINLMWIDSVSHSHFMRSMSSTIEMLKRIQREQTSYVFSYNLMQGVASHSQETVEVLFAGEIQNKTDAASERVPLDALLQRYNKGGYDVTWEEDSCWTGQYGSLIKYLGILEYDNQKRWKKLLEGLRQTGINRLDLTLSSCEVLEANGYKHQYDHNLKCYNGKSLQYYFLTHLSELQKHLQRIGKPFFHYTQTDIGHERSGRRIQAMDNDLSDYIRGIATQENMLTILFSDHGNSYGELFTRTEEAHIEKYHPMLTIIASKNMPNIIGENKMKALAVNQDRLVSALDLHYALKTLAPEGNVEIPPTHPQYDIDPMGLLSPINVNRTCDSVPRIEPNICICNGFDTYVANDTTQTMVAEFAIGEINNLIQRQFRVLHRNAETGFGSCRRLVARWFDNVQERYNTGEITTKMNIYVTAGKNASQEYDFFFVTVQTILSTSHQYMQLVNYERNSRYGQYEACADKGVDIKLCVCSLAVPITRSDYVINPAWHSHYPTLFGRHSRIRTLDNGCLFIYERRTDSGLTLEASSKCTTRIILQIDAKILLNVNSSSQLPHTTELTPGDMTFLLVFREKNILLRWKVKYTTTIMKNLKRP